MLKGNLLSLTEKLGIKDLYTMETLNAEEIRMKITNREDRKESTVKRRPLKQRTQY
ncbi:hypothetical protein [Desulfosporosinus sp. OT]|uniref:hypothetical protein n=1 Tax=Desulfosporosinus sp. OT TaxID=913865 RepID=UPI000223A03D|nr:hypothetical protein [Desulfosporosinus sp. OT]EGW37954.1 hypothetical protein DOT_4146 [Desulfosporosinus sp. OT]